MAAPITSLLDALRQIEDPRKARGVRHPYASLLALTFLGLLCRRADMAGLQRWAQDHWRTLQGPLGFSRKKPPHATTISRAAARFSLGQFRDAFAHWARSLPLASEPFAVADAASQPGHDADGEPVHRLNVFAHEVGLCLARSPATGGKPTEPEALKHALEELLANYPFLRLFTADAAFARRPLARVLRVLDRDGLFAVKDDQPSLLEALLTSLGAAVGREPDAQPVEKKGTNGTPGGPGRSSSARSPAPAGRSGPRG